jgi:hypothetical protein
MTDVNGTQVRTTSLAATSHPQRRLDNDQRDQRQAFNH